MVRKSKVGLVTKDAYGKLDIHKLERVASKLGTTERVIRSVEELRERLDVLKTLLNLLEEDMRDEVMSILKEKEAKKD